MALTSDIPLLRVGHPRDPVSSPLPSGVTVYGGSIALLASGVLKNAASPASTDTCIGLIGSPTGGSYTQTGPGIVGAGTNTAGYVYVDVETGTFLVAGGTGGDALSEATAGTTVYVIDEQTVGATNGGGTRPAAGVQLPVDPTTPTGFFPIKFGANANFPGEGA